MKKILIVAVIAMLATACAGKSGNTKNGSVNNAYNTSSNGDAQYAGTKYQIIDQEFDDMLAPESDYETLSAYELQACGDSYLPPAELKKATRKKSTAAAKKSSNKAATKVTKNKKVVNNVTVHYIDGPAPVPTGTISSSTTATTTSNSNSYAGSSSGSNTYSSGSSYSGSTNSYSSF